jgi:hypothetical protein
VRLEVGDAVPIDQHMVVPAQPGDRPTHREMGRVIDVQLVDLAHRRGAHADRHRAAADDGRQPFPLELGHHLGVPHAGDALAVRRHDDRRGDDRAARRCDPHLIDPGDPSRTRQPEAVLEGESGDVDHRITA